MTDRPPVVIGVDVGTQSARAGVFTAAGELLGRGERPLEIWYPQPDHVEQSSRDIWDAVGGAVREARHVADVPADAVVGLGFDATCSLVAVGADGLGVAVNADGDDALDVIVWMDHRAVGDARTINDTGHGVLDFVGGVLSPEMETPKLRWIKRELPDTWRRATCWFDLADYLTWRATGSEVRSLCTTVCKWTYLGHEGRWDPSFFDAIDLHELTADGFERIGSRVHAPGARRDRSPRRRRSISAWKLPPKWRPSLIDAHAGALGMIGARGHDSTADQRLAVVAGTSACHLALSSRRIDVPGVWGPYWGALLPEQWLLEAGISASGSFLDLLVRSLPASATPRPDPHGHAGELLAALARDPDAVERLTMDRHVQPNVLGNRAPLADPSLTGGIAGWTLRDDDESFAAWYLAGLQALAYATRHIVEAMTACGTDVDLVVTCGGSATNEWWLRSHADALGVPVAVPAEPDAVLLGAAMLGAVAAGLHPSTERAMREMTRLGEIVAPDPRAKSLHDRKYEVYRRMIDDGRDYRSIMRDRS